MPDGLIAPNNSSCSRPARGALEKLSLTSNQGAYSSVGFKVFWLKRAVETIMELHKGDMKEAADLLGVYQPTLRKVLSGKTLSRGTRIKLETALRSLELLGESKTGKPVSIAYSQIRTVVQGVVDEFDGNILHAARFFQIQLPTMNKILEGKSVPRLVLRKIKTQIAPALFCKDEGRIQLAEQEIATLKEFVNAVVKSEIVMWRLGVTPLILERMLNAEKIGSYVRAIVEWRIKRGDHLFPAQDEVWIKTLLLTNELYRKLGTLEAVGAHFKVTREAIRRRMERGDALGLFKYNPDRIVPSRRQLVDALKATLSITEASKSLGYSEGVIWRLVRKYNITDEWLERVRLELKRYRTIEKYMLLCREHGKVLTSTDIQRYDNNLYARIRAYYGGFPVFCEANLIEPQIFTGANDWLRTADVAEKKLKTLKKRREDWERDLLKVLDGSPPLSKRQIANALGWEEGRTENLLRSLVDDGSIQMVGRGRSARYAMAPLPHD